MWNDLEDCSTRLLDRCILVPSGENSRAVDSCGAAGLNGASVSFSDRRPVIQTGVAVEGDSSMFVGYSQNRRPKPTNATITEVLDRVSPENLFAFVDMLAFPRHYVAE